VFFHVADNLPVGGESVKAKSGKAETIGREKAQKAQNKIKMAE
jgi:hypothetical protein